MDNAARVDRWVWAVRLFRTRSEAAQACRGGRVHVNGRAAKPSTPVHAGDRVEATTTGGRRVVVVSDPIERRVGAAIAVSCYVDHSPPPPPREERPFVVREQGSGRPSKRDRRRLDRLRGHTR